jgi:hypothetical protein
MMLVALDAPFSPPPSFRLMLPHSVCALTAAIVHMRHSTMTWACDRCLRYALPPYLYHFADRTLVWLLMWSWKVAVKNLNELCKTVFASVNASP